MKKQKPKKVKWVDGGYGLCLVDDGGSTGDEIFNMMKNKLEIHTKDPDAPLVLCSHPKLTCEQEDALVLYQDELATSKSYMATYMGSGSSV